MVYLLKKIFYLGVLSVFIFNIYHKLYKKDMEDEEKKLQRLKKDRERSKKYRENNKEKLKEKGKKWRQLNPEYYKNWTKSNPERKREISKKYSDSHKESEKIKRDGWYEKNPDYNKNYYKLNKEKQRNYKREYTKNRRKNDLLFKLKDSVGHLIRSSLKRNNFIKKSKANEILGCSISDFKLHLEFKFETWMNWENYGKYNGQLNYGWDIDHIIPVSSAKNEKEIMELNHFTNLQPLDSKINRHIKKDVNILI